MLYSDNRFENGNHSRASHKIPAKFLKTNKATYLSLGRRGLRERVCSSISNHRNAIIGLSLTQIIKQNKFTQLRFALPLLITNYALDIISIKRLSLCQYNWVHLFVYTVSNAYLASLSNTSGQGKSAALQDCNKTDAFL